MLLVRRQQFLSDVMVSKFVAGAHGDGVASCCCTSALKSSKSIDHVHQSTLALTYTDQCDVTEGSRNGHVKEHHGKRGCGRIGRRSVRRLRRQNPELPADHDGMGLPRALISSVCRRDPEW